jgi:isoleucyl-tRNA synthetase
VGGRSHTLSSGDLLLTMRAPEGYSVEREGAHAVALDLAIDADLRREGRAREIVHAAQNARKAAGLHVEDRIELALEGAPELLDAASAHSDYIRGETLATALDVGLHTQEGSPDPDYSEHSEIEGLALTISLRRAP